MVKSKRFGAEQQDYLRWDNDQLLGQCSSRYADVLLPARFVSFRSEQFPAAPQAALVAAARLRGQRAFANLGPVIIDAILGPVHDAKVSILLMAIPSSLLDRISAATTEKQLTLRSVRVEELQQEIPVGGLMVRNQQACLVGFKNGAITGLSVLGSTTHDQYASLLQRERTRMEIAEDAAGGFIGQNNHNFAQCSLDKKPSVFAHEKLRVLALVSAIFLLLLAWLYLSSVDLRAQRDDLAHELVELQPIADILEQRREDIKEAAAWFDKRPQLTPMLFALTQSLPALGATDQVYLTRLRQVDAVQAVAEGVAGDRAQLLHFIQRLREHGHIKSAELRSSRKQDKQADTVSFEVLFQLNDAVPFELPSGLGAAEPAKELTDAGT